MNQKSVNKLTALGMMCALLQARISPFSVLRPARFYQRHIICRA